MMRRSTTVLTATGVMLGFASAGFAGVASAGEQLSKRQFLKAGNSICAATNQRIDAVFEEADLGGLDGNTELQTAAAEATVRSALPILRDGLDEIDALEGSAALEKKVNKLLDQYQAVIDDLEADPRSAVTQDDPFAKPNKGARKLGLAQCIQRS